LRQLAIASHNFQDTNKKLPAMWGVRGGQWGTPFVHILPFVEQNALWSAALKNAGQGGCPPDWGAYAGVWQPPATGSTASGIEVVYRIVEPYRSPQDYSDGASGQTWTNGWTYTQFAANSRLFGRHPSTWDSNTAIQNIRDGSSNVMMFTTRLGRCSDAGTLWGHAPGCGNGQWGPHFGWCSTAVFQQAPTQGACIGDLAHAFSSSGIQVAMADGTTRSVSSSISQPTWERAIIPDDNNPLGADWN
jgi:hypothetical protein